MAGDNRREFALHDSYRDVHTLLRALGLHLDDGTYLLLQLGMALLVALVVLRGHLQSWPEAVHLRTALDLGCCWIILFGPATENCTYTLVAPILALATWEALRASQSLWNRGAMIAIVSIFVVSALSTALPGGRYRSYFLMPSGGLLLFAQRLAGVGRRTRHLPPHNLQAPPLAQAA